MDTEIDNYTGAAGRIITSFTLGNEPSKNDLAIAKRLGIDIPLMREYLHHVKEQTDEITKT